MIKVFQKNPNNRVGFIRKDESDFGIDENGQLADGFQYHDALWWEGSSAQQLQQSMGINIPEFLANWNKMFMRIAEYVVYEIKPKSVLELGCGSGELSKYIRDLDGDILNVTIDANNETLQSPYYHQNHFIGRTDKVLDFVDADNNKITFDLIIAFEHFEHISENTVDTFMQNIRNHSTIGTKLLFTANKDPYPIESHKHIHCNPKPKSYWIDCIGRYGFEEYACDFEFNRAGNTSDIFSQRVK